MFDLKLDVQEFERESWRLNAALDQVPFALSLALNRAVMNARQLLIQDTWPRHVTQRNPSFLKWALHTEFSSKQKLRVEINDERAQGRGHLALHAEGGTKTARTRLAIPPKGSVTRTSSGVRKSQRPAAIIAKTPARALRITPKGIFVGIGGRLVLKYMFRQSARQPADVPFREDFANEMRRSLREKFGPAMRYAMGRGPKP